MARNKPPGCLGTPGRHEMIDNVTRAGIPLCAGGVVAIEGTAFSARLTSIRFFGAFVEILCDRAWTARWDLTRRKDVLEAGESCGDLNHRQAGDGQADHNGSFYAVTTDRDRGDLC